MVAIYAVYLSDTIVIPVVGSNALVVDLSVSVKHSTAVVADTFILIPPQKSVYCT